MVAPTFPKQRRIADLGLAAWIKSHGHQISRIDPNCVFFTVENASMATEIDNLELSYVNSEAVQFDGWLMTLKQMPLTRVDSIDPEIVSVEGLGPSAFLRMKGNWRIIGRPDRVHFAFYVSATELQEFNNLRVSWANSELRSFDAAMMQIKSVRVRNPGGPRR